MTHRVLLCPFAVLFFFSRKLFLQASRDVFNTQQDYEKQHGNDDQQYFEPIHARDSTTLDTSEILFANFSRSCIISSSLEAQSEYFR